MDNVRLFFLLLSLAALLFMVAGLFKPWLLLWWEDVQNRRKVIKLYGSIALLSYLVYLGLRFVG
ncbi:MAG: hypothetical protein KF725_01455 [Cyclobacteriaceae bacterium]|nr:hypothetical protein [Cyclobacteriaceae bacterium]UYN86884.1 MAG: hypothetical protein KIT51_00950 [Cyclobacteriaceae bacterium]